MKMDIKAMAKELQPKLVAWRRELHSCPEIGRKLPKTASYIALELEKMGLRVKRHEKTSGLVCDIVGDHPGLVVALRADMDALQVKEETGLPFASKNDAMHACGHDAHSATLLGAAEIFSKLKGELHGTIRLLFQPAEENEGGAQPMIEEGALDGVDIILGQHVGCLVQDAPSGTFSFRHGAILASRDSFQITVKGKGCHGAMPHEGVDPVFVAAHLIIALQGLISREISGTEQAVLTIGAINGGEVFNIIPDTVTLKGSLRCCDEGLRVMLEERIKELSLDICKSFRAEAETTYINGYIATRNDREITDIAVRTARRIFGEERTMLLGLPLMVSEDMSFYLEKVPGCYWFFATPQKGEVYPHHNSHFDIDEELLSDGLLLMAETALECLKETSK